MDIMLWVMPLYGLIMIAFGLYVFGIGLLGLTKKRPLVFPVLSESRLLYTAS